MKRTISSLLTLILFISIILSTTVSALTFVKRTSLPTSSVSAYKYYFNTAYSPFYPNYAPYQPFAARPSDGKYVSGNCTWYAFARAYELLGTRPKLCTNNADKWYEYNKTNEIYNFGSTPKVGAIACFGYNGACHVAVVEDIASDGTVYVSQSGWKVSTTMPTSLVFNYNKITYWSHPEDLQGYIYIMDGETGTVDQYDPNHYAVPTRTLYYNSTSIMAGSDVEWVQAVLYQLGYSITVDGIFGAGTDSSLKQFQSDYSLSVDGYVGAETRTKLIAQLEKQNDTTATATNTIATTKAVTTTKATTATTVAVTTAKTTTTTVGVTTQKSMLYGDINDDNYINSKDTLLLKQYLADWGISISKSTADVNADGSLTSKDTLLLKQYLADWNVTLGIKITS